MSDDLLDAVDALTEKRRIQLWAGVSRRDDSLFVELRKAVVSNVGSGDGASKAARERTPLDVTAFTLLEEIDGRIRSWHLDYASRPTGDISHALRTWYLMFTRNPKEESDISKHVLILTGWARRIIDIIDPPKTLELTVPCPECGRRWVTRGQGSEVESVAALTASLRGSEDYEASCAGCGRRWAGVSQLRRLRILIDETG